MDVDFMDDERQTYADKTGFRAEEDGAVTVDWVVLTASIVFMGIATAFYIASSVPEVADNVSGYMEEMTVMPD